jgi:conjugative relaxase-like TrwC/TraI family protein
MMTIKKLAGGSGYDYLVKQVAAQDAAVPAGGLTSYYSERGEAPGVWLGSGLGALGLAPGEVVTEAQMTHLFGSGEHPRADELRAAAAAAGLPPSEVEAAGRLGATFRHRDGVHSEFVTDLAARCRAWNVAAGRRAGAKVPDEVKAELRTQLGRECFIRNHGRSPLTVAELHDEIARLSKRSPVTVVGYDEAFSPPKSVSVYWALADPQTAALVERCHQAAIRDAVSYQERDALFTRSGTDGIEQIDAEGMVATGFTHRDSRAGDPDLHTHVAVANKVRTTDGRWLAIDGRLLYKSHVAASETYDASLRARLTETLGVGWVARPSRNGRRPVWEIDGIDEGLCRRFSSRRADIEEKAAELAASFRANHGRPPTGVEMIHLAQQANLATRRAKQEPRTLAEQRSTWRRQADALLGPGGVDAMLRALPTEHRRGPELTPEWYDHIASRVVTELEGGRATWQGWHVRAEALRQLAGIPLPSDEINAVVDRVVATVLHERSWQLDPGDDANEPEVLRRRDGHSVYFLAGSTTYSSSRVLTAEKRLLATAALTDGRRLDPAVVDLTLLESVANGTTLNDGQARLVTELATSGRRLQLAIAAAGTGKTTALAVLANAWTSSGGAVIGLAPSAAAAEVLAEHLGAVPCDTLAKLAHALDHPDTAPDWVATLGPNTLLIIDEAGMADTPTLDLVTSHITSLGGSVRLIGDTHQLTAVGAGGVLTDLATTSPTVRLEEVLRFTDPAEAAASLALRAGDPAAIAFYTDNHRIHPADAASITAQVLTGWATDRRQGRDAIMLAPTRDLVAQLNHQARALRLDGRRDGRDVGLADGNRASAGDVIITRRNNRALRGRNGDWVKNGDRWHITAVHTDGSITAADLRGRRGLRLPADYVEAWCELGYATTVHTAQGVTADTCHVLVTGQESRQQLYTAATRGRLANHLHVTVTGDGQPDPVDYDTLTVKAAGEIVERTLTHDEQTVSASTHARQAREPEHLLAPAVARYLDALGVAAEQHLGPEQVRQLEERADQLVLWLTEEPAWPTLRGHLLQLAATGIDPVMALREAVAQESLDGARDAAAVLDWRIDPTRHLPGGPLPWLPGVPDGLSADPTWGPYLAACADRVHDLAEQVHDGEHQPTPWLAGGRVPVPAQLDGDLRVWRTANAVPDHDLRPTGPPAPSAAAARWQRHLDGQVAETGVPDISPWWPQLEHLSRYLADDSRLPMLAARLQDLSHDGGNAADVLAVALKDGPLPADRPVAALIWRIDRHDPTREGWPPVKPSPGPRSPRHEALTHRPRHDHGFRW